MQNRYKLGTGKYISSIIEDPMTKEKISVYFPQNAIAQGNKAGEKAGNYLIERNNEKVEEEKTIRKARRNLSHLLKED